MFVHPIENRAALLSAARREIPCDLSIYNVIVFDVFTGALTPGSVDIKDGIIVRVRENETDPPPASIAASSYNGEGGYLVPGFIDTHIHIESSMMIPEYFGRVALPCGTTTVMTDPHEAANVAGLSAVDFMLQSGRKTPLRHFVLAPSCVPSVPGLENAGAAFHAEEISRLLDKEGVIGIAEVMDYVNVVADEPRMHSVVNAGLQKDVFIQGHAPRLTGDALSAYLLAGIESDHECRSGGESALKQRLGMHVNLKSSSLSNHLKANLEDVLKQRWTDHVTLCTDDVHAKTALEQGLLNRVIREAITYGADPLDLYRWATINAAREYRIRDLGAVAVGYAADLQVVPRMDGSVPSAVFVDGALVAGNGRYCGPVEEPSAPPCCAPQLDYITSEEMLRIPAPSADAGSARALVIISKYNNTAFNQGFYEEIPVKDGYLDLSSDPDLAYFACFNRHGLQTHAVGIIRGFGLCSGAYASTIAHDSHNLLMVYKDPQSALTAVRALKKSGGLCYADGENATVLPLPVFGLMSDRPAEELVPQIAAVEQALLSHSDERMYLLKIATTALPVLPGTLITDLGFVDGPSQTFLPFFEP